MAFSELRNKAVLLKEAARQIDLKATDLSSEKLVAAIVGHVSANVLEALADSVDYLRTQGQSDSLLAKRRELMDRNARLREIAAKSAASGDWTEFDKLINSSDQV